MEGGHAPQRVGAVFGDGVGDPGASVGTDQLNPGAAPWTQELKEAGDGPLTAVGRGLKQPAGVVVDDDGDVALTASMPMRRSPSKGSDLRRASSITWWIMAPTVFGGEQQPVRTMTDRPRRW